MQIGNLDVNQAIEAAKKRLNASIYGYQKDRLTLYVGKNAEDNRLRIGDYEASNNFEASVYDSCGTKILVLEMPLREVSKVLSKEG
ncbi:hypothetical protein [Nitrosomonas sp. Nm34]|uniref:hypothetical protein n=1 Tax=Nitrosomonas sp. Nm34 TaxID=1881055 RepID=UPI0008E38808|nr:hypothetical protein [Nitrosomonas sp. Nm34]SFI31232.1 hypothetical protein SAMN05428978_100558 [Nitrosomonas sp. Nm34]